MTKLTAQNQLGSQGPNLGQSGVRPEVDTNPPKAGNSQVGPQTQRKDIEPFDGKYPIELKKVTGTPQAQNSIHKNFKDPKSVHGKSIQLEDVSKLLKAGQQQAARKKILFAIANTDWEGLQTIHAFLKQEENTTLLGKEKYAWGFIGNTLMVAEQYDLANLAYNRGVNVAHRAKDLSARKEFNELSQIAAEAESPYQLEFSPQTEPEVYAYYVALVKQGIPSFSMDSDEGEIRKLSVKEVLTYYGKNLKDARVGAALKELKLELSDSDKEAIEKVGFDSFLAIRARKKAKDLGDVDPMKNRDAISQELVRALQFEPGNASHYLALGTHLEEGSEYTAALQVYLMGLSQNKENTQIKEKLFPAFRSGMRLNFLTAKNLEDEGKLAEAEAALQKILALKKMVQSAIKSELITGQELGVEILSQFGEANYLLGKIHQDKGEKKKAKEFFKKAINSYTESIEFDLNNPEVIHTYLRRSVAQYALGDYQGAANSIALSSNCKKLVVQLNPGEAMYQTFNELRQDRNEGRFQTRDGEILVIIDPPTGNYIPSEAHQLDPNNKADTIIYWADMGIARYYKKLEQDLITRTQAIEGAKAKSPPDYSVIIENLEHEINLRYALAQPPEKLKKLSNQLAQVKDEKRIFELTKQAKALTDKGQLNDLALFYSAYSEDHGPRAGTVKLDHYVGFQTVGKTTSLDFSERFYSRPAAHQIQILEGLIESADRLKVLQALWKAKGDEKLYWEAKVALTAGDRDKAKAKFSEFNKKTQDTQDPKLKTLRQEATEFLTLKVKAEQKNPNDTLRDLKDLLGPLVQSPHRDAQGNLDPSRFRGVQSFAEFKEDLASDVSIDGVAFNKYWFDSYHKIINSGRFDPLMKALYQEVNPESEGPDLNEQQLQNLFYQFQREVAQVSYGKFVSNHISSAKGRQTLRRMITDTVNFDRDFRANLLEEIMEVGDAQGYVPSHLRSLFEEQISTYMVDFNITDEELRLATRYGLKVLNLANNSDELRNKELERYSKHPKEVKVLKSDKLNKQITPERIKAMAASIEADLKKTDGISGMRARLGKFWLLVADEGNWTVQRTGHFISKDQRAFILNQIESFLSQSNQIQSNADFQAFNGRLHDFLNGHATPESNAVWNSIKSGVQKNLDMSLGETIHSVFEDMSPLVAGAYSDLRKYSDEFHIAWDMGDSIDIFDPELQVEDPKLQAQVTGMIQGLRQTKRELWYGYKQHRFLSRAGSNLAHGQTGGGDIGEIKAANREIDEIIKKLQKAKTKADFQAIEKQLHASLKADGVLHQGFAAAEMDGIEHMIGLVQTMAEIVALEVITAGIGSLGALRLGLRAFRLAKNTERVSEGVKIFQAALRAGRVRRLRQAEQTAQALAQMSRGERIIHRIVSEAPKAFMTGVYISTAENLTEKLSGGLRAQPDEILSWLKDAIATGISMGATAPLAPHAAHARRNILDGLWKRYATDGLKGLGHFGADTAVEAVEEVIDAYVRKYLDGSFTALSHDEFRDIVTISMAGGGTKMGALKQYLSRGMKINHHLKSQNGSMETPQSLDSSPVKIEHPKPANDNALPIAEQGKVLPFPQKNSAMPWLAASVAAGIVTFDGIQDAMASVGPAMASVSNSGLGTLTGLAAASSILAMAFQHLARSNKNPTSKKDTPSSLEAQKRKGELQDLLNQNPQIRRVFVDAGINVAKLNNIHIKILHALTKVDSQWCANLLTEIIAEPQGRQILGMIPQLSKAGSLGLLNMLMSDRGNDPRTLPRRFFQTEWLFENIRGLPSGNNISRAPLILEAYHHLSKVPGVLGILGMSTRIYQKGNNWVQYSSEERALWRGNVDELIRLGQIHQGALETGDTSRMLEGINVDFGKISYRGIDGKMRHSPMEADGLRKDQWIEEIKTFFNFRSGTAGHFSLSQMNADSREKFQNQVLKYAAAQKKGLIKGVVYRVTALSVDADVVGFLKANLPSVRILRYDSIADTNPDLVFEQVQAKTLTPKEFFDQHSEDVVLIVDGNLQSFSLPPAKTDSTPWALESVNNLREAHAYIQESDWDDSTPSSLEAKFKYQTEKLGETLQRVDSTLGEEIRLKTLKIFETAADLPKPMGLNYLARQVDLLFYDLIVTRGLGIQKSELPRPLKKYTQIPLTQHGEAGGNYQLFLSSKEMKRFKKNLGVSSLENQNFQLKAGMVLYSQRGYTPGEIENFRQIGGGGQYLLAFDKHAGASLPLKSFQLPNGETAYRVMKDAWVNTGQDIRIQFYGENPHLDLYPKKSSSNSSAIPATLLTLGAGLATLLTPDIANAALLHNTVQGAADAATAFTFGGLNGILASLAATAGILAMAFRRGNQKSNPNPDNNKIDSVDSKDGESHSSSQDDSSNSHPHNPEGVLPLMDPEQIAKIKITEIPDAPQLSRRLGVDETTLGLMENFPESIKDRHGPLELNPVFFGLNHLKWWLGLVKRDVAEWGADAIEQGGKILFGRWQENTGRQEEVSQELKQLSAQADVSLKLSLPQAQEWFRPLWEQSLNQDPKLLAAILQQIEQEDPDLAQEWLLEISKVDIDRCVAVQELFEGDPIQFNLSLEDDFQEDLEYLSDFIAEQDWEKVNLQIVNLHNHAWKLSSPEATFHALLNIQKVLEDWDGADLRTPRTDVPPSNESEALEILPPDLQYWKSLQGPTKKFVAGLAARAGEIASPTVKANFFSTLGVILDRLRLSEEADQFFSQADKENTKTGNVQGVIDLFKDLERDRAGQWKLDMKEAGKVALQGGALKILKNLPQDLAQIENLFHRPIEVAQALAFLLEEMIQMDHFNHKPETFFPPETQAQFIQAFSDIEKAHQGHAVLFGTRDHILGLAARGYILKLFGKTQESAQYFQQAEGYFNTYKNSQLAQGENPGHLQIQMAGFMTNVPGIDVFKEYFTESDVRILTTAKKEAAKGNLSQALQEIQEGIQDKNIKFLAVAFLANLLTKTIPELKARPPIELERRYPISQENKVLIQQALSNVEQKHHGDAKALGGEPMILTYGLLGFIHQKMEDTVSAQKLKSQADFFFQTWDGKFSGFQNSGANMASDFEDNKKRIKRILENLQKGFLSPPILEEYLSSSSLILNRIEQYIQTNQISQALKFIQEGIFTENTKYAALAYLVDFLSRNASKSGMESILPSGPGPQAIPLPIGKTILVGRHSSNDWIIGDDTVSGHHLEINIIANNPAPGFLIQDTRSTNGTHVFHNGNRQRMEPGIDYFFNPGSELHFGRNKISFKHDPSHIPDGQIFAEPGPEANTWVVKSVPAKVNAPGNTTNLPPVDLNHWRPKIEIFAQSLNNNDGPRTNPTNLAYLAFAMNQLKLPGGPDLSARLKERIQQSSTPSAFFQSAIPQSEIKETQELLQGKLPQDGEIEEVFGKFQEDLIHKKGWEAAWNWVQTQDSLPARRIALAYFVNLLKNCERNPNAFPNKFSPILNVEIAIAIESLQPAKEFLKKIDWANMDFYLEHQRTYSNNIDKNLFNLAYQAYFFKGMGKIKEAEEIERLGQEVLNKWIEFNEKMGFENQLGESFQEDYLKAIIDGDIASLTEIFVGKDIEFEKWIQAEDWDQVFNIFQSYKAEHLNEATLLLIYFGIKHGKIWQNVPFDSQNSNPKLEPNGKFFDSLTLRDSQTIPQEYRHLIPKPKDIVLFPRFNKILNETASLITAPDRIAVRFFGPAGTAKTTLPEMIAQKMGIPLLRFPFSRRTDPSDLEGLWTREKVEVKVDGEVKQELVPVFKEGAPTIAMEHGFHLVLDEPDLARPGVLAYINNVSAPGEYAWVRKQDGGLKRIKVHSDFRVYATENGLAEVAREEHGKDFLRRFVPYHVGAWTQDEVQTVLSQLYENFKGQKRWPKKMTQTLAYFHDKMRILAQGLQDPDTRQTLPPLGSGVGQQIEFTPRSVLRLAQRLVGKPLNPETLSRAIRSEYILPLADASDREMIWGQVDAIFKPIAQQMGWTPAPNGKILGPQRITAPTLASISEKYLEGKKIPPGKFVWTDQALRLVDEILWNRSLGIDVMLLGEAGTGKTETPPQIAKLLGQEYYQKTMSSETDEEDLVGGLGRTNGKIEFIPDFVTLGTQNGGIVHADEYLLSDTGKLEAVFNPLMDSTQGLILKNPYRMVPRHPSTFLVFTSNPPFGDYADRNEHSGAAMSRVAVIHLTGEFGMKSKDRLDIMRAWAGEAMPIGSKKKVISAKVPSPIRGEGQGEGGPGIRHAHRFSMPDQKGDGKQPELTVTIHPEIKERYKLPHALEFKVVDDKLQILEISEDGSAQAIQESTQKALKKYGDYLTRRTQIEMVPVTKKVIKILYRLAGSHYTSLKNKNIVLNLADLMERPLEAALGIGKHEWAHAVIDRPHEKYDAHEPGRLFANVVGDPRMNEYVASLREDFARQIDVLYQEFFEEEWSQTKIEEFLEKGLPHEQFANAILYYWRFGKVMPWIENEKVLNALKAAIPMVEPAFTLFPESTQDHHVEEAANRFYDILDKAYPFYEALFPESLRNIAERLENGETPEQIVQDALQILQQIKLPPLPSSFAPLGAKPPATNPVRAPMAPSGPVGPKGPPYQEKNDSKADADPQGILSTNVYMPDPSGEPGSPPSKQDIQKIAQNILNQRAEQMADQFEPKDPEAFKSRKEQIAQAKAQSQPDPGPSSPEPSDSPSPADSGLNAEERQKIQAERQQLIEEQLKHDLFRKLVPPQVIRIAQRLKRFLPPDNPAYLEGYFTSGKRLSRKKAAQEALNPMSDGKVMLRRLRPGDRDANVVLVSDISPSMVFSGAVDNAMVGSASAIYLSEKLKINYGEILFGKKIRVAKPLGGPLKSSKKKNELLNLKKQAFQDGSINNGTNIREGLALAIEWIKKGKAKTNHIILITDGTETILSYPKTLEELQEEAKEAGIHLLVLAMGQAQDSVPHIFEHYRLVEPDGTDIPDKILELFTEAHQRRLPSSSNPVENLNADAKKKKYKSPWAAGSGSSSGLLAIGAGLSTLFAPEVAHAATEAGQFLSQGSSTGVVGFIIAGLAALLGMVISKPKGPGLSKASINKEVFARLAKFIEGRTLPNPMLDKGALPKVREIILKNTPKPQDPDIGKKVKAIEAAFLKHIVDYCHAEAFSMLAGSLAEMGYFSEAEKLIVKGRLREKIIQPDDPNNGLAFEILTRVEMANFGFLYQTTRDVANPLFQLAMLNRDLWAPIYHQFILTQAQQGQLKQAPVLFTHFLSALDPQVISPETIEELHEEFLATLIALTGSNYTLQFIKHWGSRNTNLVALGAGMATLLSSEVAHAATEAGQFLSPAGGSVLFTSLATLFVAGVFAKIWQGIKALGKAFSGVGYPTPEWEKLQNTLGELWKKSETLEYKMDGSLQVRLPKSTALPALNLPEGAILNLNYNERSIHHVLRSYQVVDGNPMPADSQVTFDENGRLQQVILPRNHEIQGVYCAKWGPGRVEFHSNGKIKKAVLGKQQEVQGVEFFAGTTVFFNEQGDLTQADLSSEQTIEGTTFEKGSQIPFYVHDKLNAIAAPALLGMDVFLNGKPSPIGMVMTLLVTGMTAWAMAIHKDGKDSLPKRKAESNENPTALFLKSHPDFDKALDKIDWNVQHKRDFLNIWFKENSAPNDKELLDLPDLLEKMKTFGFLPEQIKLIIENIKDNYKDHNYPEYISPLSSYMEGMGFSEFSPSQHFQLILQISNFESPWLEEIIEALPEFTEHLETFDLPTENRLELIIKIVKKDCEWAGTLFEYLPDIIDEMVESAFSYKQILSMCLTISHGLKGLEDVDIDFDEQLAGVEKIRTALIHMRKNGIGFKNQKLILSILIKNSPENLKDNISDLRYFLAGMVACGQSSSEIVISLKKIAELCQSDSYLAFSFLRHRLPWLGKKRYKDFIKVFLNFLTGTSKNNRFRFLKIFDDIEYGQLEYDIDFKPETYLINFKFYTEIFFRWPRLGIQILEGVLDATDKGIVPEDPFDIIDQIYSFIQLTNGFIPSLFGRYLNEGEVFLQDIRSHVPSILSDEMGPTEIQDFKNKYNTETLLGLLQLASPVSAASLVNKSEQLELMDEVLASGDKRDHILQVWRGMIRRFRLKYGEWHLKSGQKIDPKRKIGSILNRLTKPFGKNTIREDQVVQALIKYIQSSRDEKARQNFREILLSYAGQNETIRQQIVKIHELNYFSLSLLQQLFQDPDYLPKFLFDILGKVPQKILSLNEKPKITINNSKQLINSLTKVWSGKVGRKALSKPSRLEIMANILKPFSVQEIENKLFSRNLEPSLKEAIQKVMGQPSQTYPQSINAEIFRDIIQLIKIEKNKFNYLDNKSINLSLQAVKGPAHGLHGVCSGVCTAPDMYLWDDSNFKLFAILDENNGKIVGYIHVYEIEMDGKKYLSLPGINPSVEFLGVVNGQDLYNKMMPHIIEFAQAGDFHGIFIPTDPNIHSNRQDIQKAIKTKNYPVKTIPQVNWNHIPKPFPFSRVYVVWEKSSGSKIGPSKINTSEGLHVLTAPALIGMDLLMNGQPTATGLVMTLLATGLTTLAMAFTKNEKDSLPKSHVLSRCIRLLDKLKSAMPPLRRSIAEELEDQTYDLEGEDIGTFTQEIIDYWDHPDAQVRKVALELLDYLVRAMNEEEGNHLIEQIFSRSLSNSEYSTHQRVEAIHFLWELFIDHLGPNNRKGLAKNLIIHLGDSDPEVRWATLNGLRVFYAFDSVDRVDFCLNIADFLQDPRDEIQDGALEALWNTLLRLGSHEERNQLATRLAEHLASPTQRLGKRAEEISQMILFLSGPDEKWTREELLQRSGLITLRFADGGEGISTIPRFFEHFRNLPPIRKDLNLKYTVWSAPSVEHSLSQFLRDMGVKGEGQPLGRSVAYRMEKSAELLVLKYRRPEQSGRDIIRENQWLQKLWEHPSLVQELRGLAKQKYPRPMIDHQGRPSLLKFKDEKTGQTRQAIVFKAHPDYFRYLDDPQLPDTEFMMGLTDGIHDIFTLARYGVFHTAPITIFHNRTSSEGYTRRDRGRYVISPDFVFPNNPVPGMGRLDNWPEALRFGNLGVTGLRDFEELANLDVIVFNNKWMPELQELLIKENSKENYEAMILGNALLAGTLYIGNRMAQAAQSYSGATPFWKNHSWLRKYTNQLLGVYATAYAARWEVSIGEARKILTPRADWYRLARQLAFFMTPAHVEYVKSGQSVEDFPQEIYGPRVTIRGGIEGDRSVMGPYREGSFDRDKGFIGADGDPESLALGPVNGQNPITEFEKAWVATLF